MSKPGLDERLKQLGDRIEAARARISAHSAFADDDVGHILASINDDLEAVTHDDEAGAHARYDAIEKRIGVLEARMGGGKA